MSKSEIDDFKERPASFFSFHTEELKSEMWLVSDLRRSASSPSIPGFSCGNSRTSIEDLPYSSVER